MRAPITVFLCALVVASAAQYPLLRSVEIRAGQQRPRITRIDQDRRGLIWTASDIGLHRTDGVLMERIWHDPSERITALTTDDVQAVFVTDRGRLIRCHDHGCDTLFQDTLLVSQGASINRISSGVYAMGTYGNGLILFNGSGTQRIDSRSGLPDDHVNDMALLSDGRLAIATDQGLALVKEGEVEQVLDELSGAPDNLILSVDVAADGSIWAGTDRAGVFRWDPGSPKRPRSLEIDRELGPVNRLRVTGNLLWAVTRDAGPVAIDLTLERGSYRVPWGDREAVVDIMRDHAGTVWWCDGTDVLQRADPAFLFVPEHEGLDLRGITALCADHQESIWFATPGGIYRHVTWFSEDRKVQRLPVEIDPRTPVVSLAVAPDGTVWAGTFGAGAYAIKTDGTIVRYTEKDGLSNDNVLGVQPAEHGVVLATLRGVTVVDAQGMRPAGQEAGFVFHALMSGDRIVMATDGKGMVTLGASDTQRRAASRETFYSLCQVPDGTVWGIGPHTGFCMENAVDSLCPGATLAPFDGEVYALGAVDGHLLAFGSTGVTAFDPQTGELMDVTAAFGMRDMTAELNTIAHDASGALWFACSKGLVRMRPHAAHFDPKPMLAMLGAEVNGQWTPMNDRIHTTHDRNDLLFRFTAIHWADPEAIRFQYRLLGHGTRIEETGDRQVSFAALPPGSYTFQVRAVIGTAGDNAPWSSLSVEVEAPWWRKPWVIGFLALAGIGIIALLIRLRDQRVRYRERMEKDKVRFQLDALRSQVDPHFLFNSFNALIELIESDPPRAVEHVEQLSTFFRNILQVRDAERIDLDEELRLLHTYFALEQRRFGEALSLQINVPAACFARTIVPLTLQLLVENALKHNVVQGSEPFIITVTAHDELLEVTNPYRPRSTPPRSTGFGLESITKRYGVLTSRPITASTENGHFVVRIPLLDPTA